MANVPAAPLEGSGDTSIDNVPLPFMTEDDGAGGLRSALWVSLFSEIVNGQRLGSLGVASRVGTDTTYLYSVTVGTTTTKTLYNNASRVSAVFCNDSDEAIYLGLGISAALNQGIRIGPGKRFELDFSNLTVGNVDSICASGGKNLTVHETYRL